MLFSVAQLIAHFIGDYLLQSHWMATEKRKASIAAVVHVAFYGLAFVLVGLLDGCTLAGKQIQTFKMSLPAFAVIVGTHFAIDRWGLARYVVWAKNWIGPFWRKRFVSVMIRESIAPEPPDTRPFALLLREDAPAFSRQAFEEVPLTHPWRECEATGFPPETPAFLAVWLLIITDNVMHVVINALALWCL